VITRTLAAAMLLAFAPAFPGASAGQPPLALTASPSHLTLVGSVAATIRVVNQGASPLVVEAAPAGFTLGLRGRPRILLAGTSARRAASWFDLRPRLLVLAPGGGAELALVASPRHGAAPGDYPAVVLITARAARSVGVTVRMRIGITVVVRVSGRTRHRLVVQSARLRRVGDGCVVTIGVRNGGNVVERLRRGAVRASLAARGRVLAVLDSQPRELLPHTRAVVELPYRRRCTGRVTAVVTVSASSPRTFHLLL
jgi:hypothetical protein